MRPASFSLALAAAAFLAGSMTTGGAAPLSVSGTPQASQAPSTSDQPAARGQGRRGGGGQAAGRGRGRGAEIPPWAILRAPAGVKEGDTWVPAMPPMEDLLPPPGWKPDGIERAWIPATLLRIPRTNITRAKYPAIDFHNHTGRLTTREQYEAVVKLLDQVGVGAVVNLNGGTGDDLDAVLKAGDPFRDRVANFVTFSGAGINEPGWSERFAALMERGFKAGAMGMKVSKQLGQGLQNPDGSFIQADDPRLDPIWAMAAKHKKPVMIHTSDSIGRFYPISDKNERYDAGLWHRPGDESGNLYKTGPKPEVIERARENMHRKHPNTTFVNAHMAMLYYDPQKLAAFLDTYPNGHVEISATVQDLGRAPRMWREFLIKYQDRVFFGTDGNANSHPDTFWNPHFRYLETYDEYFEHPAQIRLPGGAPGHGRWNISGVSLPDEVLRKIYYENALKVLPSLRQSVERQMAARK
jgi:predicted TIM-barrel fold metal-dependent hydrolase